MTIPLSQTPAVASGCSAPSTSTGRPLFHNRFEIVKRLGKGGFGTTYLAQEITAEYTQPCVIKQLRYRSQPAQSETIAAMAQERHQRRFQKEARIMARIGRHDQLPCLLDHFVDDGRFYLVQEYVPGVTLQQLRHQGGLWNEDQVKRFLRGMIPIVRHIHRHNLLHLDIKPSNIIRRSTDQQLVLIDFGAVRQYRNDGMSTKPERGAGTIGFAPGEQLAGQPTPASDIYSLGVTCLYLLTGCSPLDLATSPQGQNLRWQESVQVGEHLTRLLHKMLAPEANQRFQSIDALERAVELEPYYEELKPCMTREPMSSPAFKTPTACLIEDYAGPTSHRSQAARQASSIRRWQQRRRQFKSFVPK